MSRLLLVGLIVIGALAFGYVLSRVAHRWGKNEAHGGNLFGPNDPGGAG